MARAGEEDEQELLNPLPIARDSLIALDILLPEYYNHAQILNPRSSSDVMCACLRLNQKGNITRLPTSRLSLGLSHISISHHLAMAEKEATVYIVDVGKSMGERRHGRHVTDLEWAMQYVWDRITTTVCGTPVMNGTF